MEQNQDVSMSDANGQYEVDQKPELQGKQLQQEQDSQGSQQRSAPVSEQVTDDLDPSLSDNQTRNSDSGAAAFLDYPQSNGTGHPAQQIRGEIANDDASPETRTRDGSDTRPEDQPAQHGQHSEQHGHQQQQLSNSEGSDNLAQHTHDDSSSSGVPPLPPQTPGQHAAGGPIRTSHARTPAVSTPSTAGRSGRTSIMLGEDGRIIPEHEKPAVGTEEYVQMRRINHKEVEKKRRENINDGINQLASLLQKEYAGQEKNKGAILSRAANYIEQLKQSEADNLERYTLDKLLCDQTITELQSKVDQLQAELERAYQMRDAWRAAADGGPRPVEHPDGETGEATSAPVNEVAADEVD
ncbi:basic helix-loop-helix protein [Savitreella phatthalungensis]